MDCGADAYDGQPIISLRRTTNGALRSDVKGLFGKIKLELGRVAILLLEVLLSTPHKRKGWARREINSACRIQPPAGQRPILQGQQLRQAFADPSLQQQSCSAGHLSGVAIVRRCRGLAAPLRVFNGIRKVVILNVDPRQRPVRHAERPIILTRPACVQST